MGNVLPDLPEYFYKYLPFDAGTQSAINDSTIKFAAPGSFNDPFDINIPLLLEGTDEEWRRYLNSLVRENRPNLSPAVRMQEVRRMMRSRAFRDLEPRRPTDFFADIGVLCVSASVENILMWSHYADHHKGVCLRWRSITPDHFFLRAQKVIYQVDLPSARIFDDHLTRMNATILTKSSDWAYEQEWRIIEHRLGPGIHPFAPEDLDAIIIGCRATEETVEKIQNAVHSLGNRPQVLFAKRAERQFRLEIEDSA